MPHKGKRGRTVGEQDTSIHADPVLLRPRNCALIWYEIGPRGSAPSQQGLRVRISVGPMTVVQELGAKEGLAMIAEIQQVRQRFQPQMTPAGVTISQQDLDYVMHKVMNRLHARIASIQRAAELDNSDVCGSTPLRTDEELLFPYVGVDPDRVVQPWEDPEIVAAARDAYTWYATPRMAAQITFVTKLNEEFYALVVQYHNSHQVPTKGLPFLLDEPGDGRSFQAISYRLVEQFRVPIAGAKIVMLPRISTVVGQERVHIQHYLVPVLPPLIHINDVPFADAIELPTNYHSRLWQKTLQIESDPEEAWFTGVKEETIYALQVASDHSEIFAT